MYHDVVVRGPCSRILSRMRRAIQTTGILSLLLLPFGVAHAQWITYDNFSGPLLNVNKWQDAWFSADALQISRRQSAGKLELGVATMGNLLTDSGQTAARNRIRFPSRFDGRIQGIESRMWVVSGKATHCPRAASAKDTRGRLRQFVTWFNDGSSTGDDDLTGNVQSYFSLRVAPDNALPQLRFWVWRCTDSNCNNNQAAEISSNFLGTVRYGQAVQMRTTYNASNNSLTFWAKPAGKAPVSRLVRLSTLASFSAPPADPFNAIEARAQADNCRLGPNAVKNPRRPIAQIDGRVDQVRIRQFAN